jgi:hypothetical protein
LNPSTEWTVWLCIMCLAFASMDYDPERSVISTNYIVLIVLVYSILRLIMEIWRGFK